MKRDAPCYMCPARTPACHCTCDKYRATMLEYVERREHRRAEASMVAAMRDMALKNKHRNEVIARNATVTAVANRDTLAVQNGDIIDHRDQVSSFRTNPYTDKCNFGPRGV